MDEWTPERWAGRALDYFLAANGRIPEADHALFISAVTHMVRQAVEQERDTQMAPEPERPWQMYHELDDATFREIVDTALLKVYKPEIQKHYRVAGFAQLQDGKWIIKLERRIFPD